MPEKHDGNFAGTHPHKTGSRVLCPYSERPMNGNVNKLFLIENVFRAGEMWSFIPDFCETFHIFL
jgi:hypothetical protein